MTDEKNVFIASGKEYDRDRLLDVIANNTEGYAHHRQQMLPERRNMFGKVKLQGFDVEGFRQAVDDIKKEITNGKLSMDSGNLFRHSDGLEWKDPLHTAALDLVSKSVAALSEEKLEKPKYSNTRIFDRFNNKFYGGNFKGSESDYEMWKNGSKGINDIKALLDEEISDIQNNDLDYTGSAYKNKDEYLARLQQLRTNLDNEVSESDLADWVALGGDSDFFRAITGLKVLEPPRENALLKQWEEIENQLIDSGISQNRITLLKEQFFKQKQQELEAPFLDLDYNLKWNEFASSHWTGSGETKLADLGTDKIDLKNWYGWYNNEADKQESWLKLRDNASYADKLYNDILNGTFNQGNHNGYSNTHILRMYMHDALQHDPSKFTPLEKGVYLLNDSVDLNSGTAIKYDKNKRLFYRVHVDPKNTPKLLTLLKKLYGELNPYGITNNLRWGSFNKKGGKLQQLKFLRNGGDVIKALSGAELAQINEEKRLNKYELSVKQRAKDRNMSVEQIKTGDQKASTDSTVNSWLRGIGTTFDVAGAGLSFIPLVGNAAGAIAGTIGTGLHLTADALDDSVSREEMYTNLGINAGLTGLMLIPGGGSAKLAGKAIQLGAKASKTAKAMGLAAKATNAGLKYVKPVVHTGMVGYGGYSSIENWDRMQELRKKADEGKLSHEERRELDYIYSIMAGTVTGGKHLAGRAAPHLGNNVFGKTAAAVYDPITAARSALGNKNASEVFKMYTRSLKDPGVVKLNEKDAGFWATDSEGNRVRLNEKQAKAMRAAVEKVTKNSKWTDEEMLTALRDAYVKNADDPSTIAKTTKEEWTTRELSYTEEQNKALGDVLKSSDLSEDSYKFTINGADSKPIEVSISKESIKPIQKAYLDAAAKVKRPEGMSDDDFLAAQHKAGLKEAKLKLAELEGVGKVKTEVSSPKISFDYGITPGADASTISRILPNFLKLNKNPNIEEVKLETRSKDIWANKSNNLQRLRFDRISKKYMSNVYLALRDLRLNNNFEMLHGEGAIRWANLKVNNSSQLVVKGLRLMFGRELEEMTDSEILQSLHTLKQNAKFKDLNDADLFSEISKLKFKTKKVINPITKQEKTVKVFSNNGNDKYTPSYNKKSFASILKSLIADKKHKDKKFLKAVDMAASAEVAEKVKNPNGTTLSLNTVEPVVPSPVKPIGASSLQEQLATSVVEGLQQIASNNSKAEPSMLSFTPRRIGYKVSKDNSISVNDLIDNMINDPRIEKYTSAPKQIGYKPILLNALKQLGYTEALSSIRSNVMNFNIKDQNFDEFDMARFMQLWKRKGLQSRIDTKNRIVEAYDPKSQRLFNFYYKQGGSINPLKELRTNFTTDNSNSSTGLSKFLHGGKPSGVQLSAGTTWLNDIFNVYKQDLLDKLSKNGSAAMDDINSMQDRQHKMYTDALASGNWQDKAFTYGGDDDSIMRYQLDYDNQDKYGYNSKEGLDAIKQVYNKGRYKTTGTRTSGDGIENEFKVDDLFSAITDDRRILGRKGDWNEDSDEFKAFNKKLNDLGYEMYLDKDKTDYYKIRKLNSNSDNSEEGKKQGISRADPGTHTVYEDNNDYGLDKYAKALLKAAPEALSMFRFLKNLNNNKKIRDLALQKQPAYLEPIYKHKNVYGDFWALVNALKNAANTLSKAQNIAENTSDSQLAALTQLEGQRNANQEKLRGVAADNAAIKQSIQEHDAVNDAMYDYNHKVADENNARMVAKINSDIDARMGYHSANTTNWNNWLSEHEQRFRINQNDAKQRLLADYAQRISDWQSDQIKNDPEYLRMYLEYMSTTDTSKRELLLRDMREFLYNRSLAMQPILRQMRPRYILGTNLDDNSIFNNLYTGTSDYKIKTKHGGRLTVDSSRMKYRADDLRELRKLIKHNIDTNRKALDNLSRATLLELKKMMGI